MSDGREYIDEVTGVETTHHEWDGIKELNNPLPRWWLWTFYVSIAWALVYFVLYPAWPTLSGYTKGTLGYSQRATVAAEVEVAKAAQAGNRELIAKTALADIAKNPELLRFSLGAARIRATTGASAAGRCSARASDPAVVGKPATSTLSLKNVGTPSK